MRPCTQLKHTPLPSKLRKAPTIRKPRVPTNASNYRCAQKNAATTAPRPRVHAAMARLAAGEVTSTVLTAGGAIAAEASSAAGLSTAMGAAAFGVSMTWSVTAVAALPVVGVVVVLLEIVPVEPWTLLAGIVPSAAKAVTCSTGMNLHAVIFPVLPDTGSTPSFSFKGRRKEKGTASETLVACTMTMLGGCSSMDW